MHKLKQPSGKQDQYISVYGGVSEFLINKKGYVNVRDLKISKETILNLEDNLLLFFTGFSRDSSLILKEQNKKTIKKDKEIIENLNFVKSLGYEIKETLIKGRCNEFGKLLNEHWQHKMKRSINMSNPTINEAYNYAIKNGALGGKLIGAGGGGFLLFYSESPNKLRRAFLNKKFEEVRFKFDFEGVKKIF